MGLRHSREKCFYFSWHSVRLITHIFSRSLRIKLCDDNGRERENAEGKLRLTAKKEKKIHESKKKRKYFHYIDFDFHILLLLRDCWKGFSEGKKDKVFIIINSIYLWDSIVRVNGNGKKEKKKKVFSSARNKNPTKSRPAAHLSRRIKRTKQRKRKKEFITLRY